MSDRTTATTTTTAAKESRDATLPSECPTADDGVLAAVLDALAAIDLRPRAPFEGARPELPCSLPVSMTRDIVDEVVGGGYYVSEKSNGVRYFLVLTRVAGSGRPTSVMVDRDMKSYEIRVAAHVDFFRGTVLDGELVVTPGGAQHFVAFDALRCAGVDVRRRTYARRLAMLSEALSVTLEVLDGWRDAPSVAHWERRCAAEASAGRKVVSLGNRFDLSFRLKPCLPARELQAVYSAARRSSANVEGVVFTPNSAFLGPGRCRRLFKLKFRESVTLDLLVELDLERAGAAHDVLFSDRGALRSVADQTFRHPFDASDVRLRLDARHLVGGELGSALTHAASRRRAVLQERADAPRSNKRKAVDGDREPAVPSVVRVLVEFFVPLDDAVGGAWLDLVPFRVRRDKSAPNSIATIAHTLAGIADAVSVADVTRRIGADDAARGHAPRSPVAAET